MGNISYLRRQKHNAEMRQREFINIINKSKGVKKIFYQLKLFFINDFINFLSIEIDEFKKK